MSLVVGRMLAHSSAPVAALSANLAAGCVGLFAPLATVITSLGLDWLHWWDVQQPILYGASALALASLGHSAWRHGRPWPLLLGAGSVGALLYPLHDALDVTTFRILMNAGAAGLAAAAIWSFLLCHRAARRLGLMQ